MSRPLRIFLCHASEDKVLVRELAQRLHKDGFEPWFDEERLLPGQDWDLEISTAVGQCDAVLVCLSPHSTTKVGYVQKEIRKILDIADHHPDGRIFVIPVRLQECAVPARLGHWQRADLFTPGGYERLKAALRVRSAGTDCANAAPPRPEPRKRIGTPLRRPLWVALIGLAAAGVIGTAFYVRPTIPPTIPRPSMASPSSVEADVTGDLQVFTTPEAQVEVNGDPVGMANAAGELTIPDLGIGEYRLTASRSGYNSATREAKVSRDAPSVVTLELKPSAFTDEKGSQPPVYKLHRRLSGPAGTEPQARFRADSQQLMTWAVGDDRVMIWDPATGRQLKELRVEADNRVLTASADFRSLAVTVERGVIQILDVASGRETTRFQVDQGRLGNSGQVAFTRDGQRLATVSENAAGVWDVITGKRLFALPQDPSIGYVSFGPDGGWLATGLKGVTVWDAERGQKIRRFGEAKDVREMTLSPSGRWLAFSTPSRTGWQIEIWDATDGAMARKLILDDPNNRSFNDIEFTADSRYLITAMDDSSFRIWDPASGRALQQWTDKALNDAVWSIAMSADGTWMVNCTSFGDFTIWRRAE